MMCEPVTIAKTCLEVVNHIWTLSDKVKDFVLLVREARADMLGLTSELSTLSLSISMLQDDCTKIPFPESVLGDLSANLEDVLEQCGNTTKEMIKVLDLYMSAEFLPKLRWAVNGRDRINKLKSNIESCKPAIGFALMVGQVVLLKSIKNDTEAIRNDTAVIKNDTALIPDVKDDTTTIIKMLSDKLSLPEQLTGKQFVMQKFYDEMTTTAESVVDEMEAASMTRTPQRKGATEDVYNEVSQFEVTLQEQGPNLENVEPKVEKGDDIDVISTCSFSSSLGLIPQEPDGGLDGKELNKTDTNSAFHDSEPESSENGKNSVELEGNEETESPGLKHGSKTPVCGMCGEAPPQIPELSLYDTGSLEGFEDFWQTSYNTEFASISFIHQKQTINGAQALENNNPKTPDLTESDTSSCGSTEEDAHINASAPPKEVATPATSIPSEPLVDKRIEIVDSSSQSSGKENYDENISKESEIPSDIPLGSNLPKELDKKPLVVSSTSTNTDVQLLKDESINGTKLLKTLLMSPDMSITRPDPVPAIKELLDARAALNYETQTYDALLTGVDGALAAEVQQAGRPEIVKLLLSYGAKANRYPIIDISILCGTVEAADLLLKNKATCPEFSDAVLGEILQISQRQKSWTTFLLEHYNFSTEMQNKSVFKAAESGYARLLDDLLSKFGNMDAKNLKGQFLCTQAAASGRQDIVEVILRHKPQESVDALRVASQKGHVRIVELLLDYGTDINGRGPDNLRALHGACEGNHLEVVKILLQRGARASLKSKSGRTPLQTAQDYGKENLIFYSPTPPRLVTDPRISDCQNIIGLLEEAEKAEKAKKNRFWSRS